MSDSTTRGPLPQWKQPHGVGTALYEANDPHGRRWRLWSDANPPATWRLAPVDDLGSVEHVPGEHGLYFALDTAG